MSNKKLKLAVVILLIMAIAGFLLLAYAYKDKPIDGNNFKIVIYDDGSAGVFVSNAAYIQQLEQDVKFGNHSYLRAGTLIIPGNGDTAIFEYTRSESVGGNDDE